MIELSRVFRGNEVSEKEITTLIEDFRGKHSIKDAELVLTKSGFADTMITVRLK